MRSPPPTSPQETPRRVERRSPPLGEDHWCITKLPTTPDSSSVYKHLTTSIVFAIQSPVKMECPFYFYFSVTYYTAEIRCGRETVSVEMAVEGRILLSFFRPQNRLAKKMTFSRDEFAYLVKTLQEFLVLSEEHDSC